MSVSDSVSVIYSGSDSSDLVFTPDGSSSSYSPPPSGSPSNFDDDEEMDSLPSSTDSESDLDERESDAERQWKESLEQLELLLTMVLVPYIGKYFGRKCAYWGWARYMEWKYPVEVVVTDQAAFKGIGAVVAAASL